MRLVRWVIAASLALLLSICPVPLAAEDPSQASAIQVDVAVLGGTPEGVAAAVAAARAGRTVLLIEERDRLGGLLVHGGLNSLDLNRAPDDRLRNAVAGSPAVEKGQIRGLPVFYQGQVFPVTAGRYIDATEDADMAAAAGVAFTVGRSDYTGSTRGQPVTLVFRLTGVDWQSASEYWCEVSTGATPSARCGASTRSCIATRAPRSAWPCAG